MRSMQEVCIAGATGGAFPLRKGHCACFFLSLGRQQRAPELFLQVTSYERHDDGLISEFASLGLGLRIAVFGGAARIADCGLRAGHGNLTTERLGDWVELFGGGGGSCS